MTDAANVDVSEAAHRKWFRYTLPGAYGALIFGCLSFAPSLLPRGGLLQGALLGVNAAIGYGLGVCAAWIWRAFADRDPRPTRRNSWRWFLGIAVVFLLVSYVSGSYLQGKLRDLMGMAAPSWIPQLLLPVIAALLFVGLVALSRALRRLYRGLARLLHHWIGPKAANAVGWAVVVGGTYLVVSGVLLSGLVDLADQTFSVTNGNDKPGVTQTTSSLRSGGPGSEISWDSLGREGRSFVATGPTAQQISDFTGQPAMEPIRAFAGLETSDDSETRAEMAVADLDRAGGFQRKYLMIATTTGSGWISPGAVDSFEYMTGGDSAIVGMQYSYLPSWISYLVDQQRAREAGRDLFDAVYERWLQEPAKTRPKLIIFGESLGSFGAEAAFSGEHDLANRIDGALLTGPPEFNTLHQEFTADRDPGSTEVAPVYKDGRIVRFANESGEPVAPVGQPWDGTRVLYVQHPSDPIVWWSPNLLFHAPDWLSEPAGTDRLDEMGWLPIVTFWQISADLPYSTGVPPGHGHVYTPSYVEGWATVLQPPGWTDEKQTELTQLIATSAD